MYRWSGLPNDNYWTGTENSNNPGNYWIVDGSNNPGNVNVNSDDQSNDNRVVCVP